ncbi:hypothetical protein J7J83_00630 [bacterium]|nr:hypothetical protein [bacterium]
MTKKLIFAGALTTGLTILTLLAQTASADYYDCNGNVRSGNPRPSECHYYLTPSRSRNHVINTSSDSSTMNHRSRNHVINTSSDSSTMNHRSRNHVINTSSDSSNTTHRERNHVVTDNSRNHVVTNSNRHRENIITGIGRNYSNIEKARNSRNAIIENDPGNYSKKYEVRNARKYCVRDYCYIVYDYCYDLSHCEEKVQRVPRDDYWHWNDWRNNLNKYLDEYLNKAGQEDCNRYDPNQDRCIYRGFHFGGYHNGYWYN